MFENLSSYFIKYKVIIYNTRINEQIKNNNLTKNLF